MRMGVLRKLRGGGSHNDRGANLVEFALLAPLLILLVLGIVEFGWKFSQFNDVRHAAREGARFAAVNAGNNTDIENHVCATMDAFAGGVTSVQIILDEGGGAVGDTGNIQVIATVASLTGAPLITTFLPTDLSSDIDFRLEQPAIDWGDTTPPHLSC